MRTTIVHGPQSCGKTRHAEALARHFGCDRVVDDWDGFSPIPAGALVLTNLSEFRHPPEADVLPFGEAVCLL